MADPTHGPQGRVGLQVVVHSNQPCVVMVESVGELVGHLNMRK